LFEQVESAFDDVAAFVEVAVVTDRPSATRPASSWLVMPKRRFHGERSIHEALEGHQGLKLQNPVRRSFADANSPAHKTFAFTLILHEGVAPNTAFGVLGGI